MTACDRTIGVKQILLAFTDCDTGQKYGPFAHKQGDEELPVWRLVDFVNEEVPGGWVERKQRSMYGEFTVNKDPRLPSSFYQGKAAISGQIEYRDGRVITFDEAAVAGDDASDLRKFKMRIVSPLIDELLPAGALVAA